MTISNISPLSPLTVDTLTIDPYTTTHKPFNILKPIDSIQGQMITATIKVNHDEKDMIGMSAAGFQEMMKKNLCMALIEEMVKNKVIEFTSQMHPVELTTTYRARVYATPDTEIRMIRKSQSF